MDMPDAEETLAEFKQKLADDPSVPDDVEIMPISSLNREGVQPLMRRTADLLDVTPQFIAKGMEPESETTMYEFKDDQPAFQIDHAEDDLWIVYGDEIEDIMRRTNTAFTESLMRLHV
ncbi:Spo0B-associated GTP-binding protein [Weissella viridescens]|uniref:Spo0B-associated GTP-binding protein n=1 Tax=Weissella viridescens TaxID=1629 RepID=A0A380PA09_WEIVI|nr:Spo0B-associated GTP-binding protein [Weissella viridescens]